LEHPNKKAKETSKIPWKDVIFIEAPNELMDPQLFWGLSSKCCAEPF
jgi:hypothetical protein